MQHRVWFDMCRSKQCSGRHDWSELEGVNQHAALRRCDSLIKSGRAPHIARARPHLARAARTPVMRTPPARARARSPPVDDGRTKSERPLLTTRAELCQVGAGAGAGAGVDAQMGVERVRVLCGCGCGNCCGYSCGCGCGCGACLGAE